MRQTAKKRRLKTFPGLKPMDFMHPWDSQAISALQKIPGFDMVIAKLMEYGWEQILRLSNLSRNLRVNETMLPTLHSYLRYACQILRTDEPELYVSTNPEPNAYTYGNTRPFIVLTTGLIDMLEDEELFFAIAHELGHIKCGHVLYRTMAQNFAMIMEIAGRATLGLGNLLGTGLQLALFDWERKSELSADRAALLCVQDIQVAGRVFMKLAGGGSRLFSEMNAAEFFRQIRAYEDASDQNYLNKVYTFLMTAAETHPFIVMRAKQLDAWVAHGEYHKITGLDMEPTVSASAGALPNRLAPRKPEKRPPRQTWRRRNRQPRRSSH